MSMSFLIVFVLVAFFLSIGPGYGKIYSQQALRDLRGQVLELFDHAYYSYKNHGLPFDELDAIKCCGVGFGDGNSNRTDYELLGGYYLTLVDSLDTLAIMGKKEEFKWAVDYLAQHLDFGIDNTVIVFEANIRVLGGLLAGHLIASTPAFEMNMHDVYHNELLHLAHDLGKRLLRAFDGSPSQLPYAQVNLLTGKSCCLVNTKQDTASVGTLLLEFGVLSRLTGDPSFESAASLALDRIWKRRSSHNLLGSHIDVNTSKWLYYDSGIGAGGDSIYEYMLKGSILFGNTSYMHMFEVAYHAIMKHMRSYDGLFYLPINMHHLNPIANSIDALGAFFPGLQVLYGDIDEAARHYLAYYMLWTKYQALPEKYNVLSNNIVIDGSLLRPELIESTYLLFKATKDTFYLDSGERMLHALNRMSRITCGFAPLKNITSREKGGRMPSFFLGETLKYLYLLFDPDNILHRLDHLGIVFSTEAHILLLPLKARGRSDSPYGDPHLMRCCSVYPVLFSTLTARYCNSKVDRPLYPMADVAQAFNFKIPSNRSASNYNPFLAHYGPHTCAHRERRDTWPPGTVSANFSFPIDELTGESLYMPFIQEKACLNWCSEQQYIDFKLVPAFSVVDGDCWHCYPLGAKTLTFLYALPERRVVPHTAADQLKEPFAPFSEAAPSGRQASSLRLCNRLHVHQFAWSFLHTVSFAHLELLAISIMQPFSHPAKPGPIAGFVYLKSELLCKCAQHSDHLSCCFLDAFGDTDHLQADLKHGSLIVIFRLGGSCSLKRRAAFLQKKLPLKLAHVLVINEFDTPFFNFVPYATSSFAWSEPSHVPAIPMSLISNRDGRDLLASMDLAHLGPSESPCEHELLFASSTQTNITAVLKSGLPLSTRVNSSFYIRELVRGDYKIELQHTRHASSASFASEFQNDGPDTKLEQVTFIEAFPKMLDQDDSPKALLALPLASHAAAAAAALMVPAQFNVESLTPDFYYAYATEKIPFGGSHVNNIERTAVHPIVFDYLSWLLNRETGLKGEL